MAAGTTDHAMVVGQAMSANINNQNTMVVAGVGFSSSATQVDIAQAVRNELAANGLKPAQLKCLAVLAIKQGNQSLENAAQNLATPLAFITDDTAKTSAGRGLTQSQQSVARTGLPSASEAAALGAAGPASTLVTARRIHGQVTCALAWLNTNQNPTSETITPIHPTRTDKSQS